MSGWRADARGAPWLAQCRRGAIAEVRRLQPAISDIDEQPGQRYKKGNGHVDQGAVAFKTDTLVGGIDII